MYKKVYIWKPTTCSCNSGRYLASVIDNSEITSDETTEKKKKKVKYF